MDRLIYRRVFSLFFFFFDLRQQKILVADFIDAAT